MYVDQCTQEDQLDHNNILLLGLLSASGETNGELEQFPASDWGVSTALLCAHEILHRQQTLSVLFCVFLTEKLLVGLTRTATEQQQQQQQQKEKDKKGEDGEKKGEEEEWKSP